MQKFCLKVLAAKGDYLKGFTRMPGVTEIPFQESHKELDRVINALHFLE